MILVALKPDVAVSIDPDEEVDLDQPLGPDTDITRREAVDIVTGLLHSYLNADIDETERVMDRAAMLDPEGKTLPFAVVTGICEAIHQSLPADLRDSPTLELEVDRTAGSEDSDTETAFNIYIAYHENDMETAARLFFESVKARTDDHAPDVAVMVALLAMWRSFHLDSQEAASDSLPDPADLSRTRVQAEGVRVPGDRSHDCPDVREPLAGGCGGRAPAVVRGVLGRDGRGAFRACGRTAGAVAGYGTLTVWPLYAMGST